MTATNLDSVDWADISILIGWTTLLTFTMAFLWHHRRLPHLQIRRLPLVFTALISLHLYSSLAMLARILGTTYPCTVEYWVMSILLPFGIALFQIANTQFLHIASQQKRYVSVRNLDELVRGRDQRLSVLDGQTGSLWHRTLQRLRKFDQLTQMVMFVCAGMVVQAVLTMTIFLMSRKFHHGFGVLPTDLFDTDAKEYGQCIRGWEWWLSIVWQFFWAWLYAPYILWRSRNIQDTHGWRIQTILCCIAGLPCSPLWLCGLYLPQFAPVNVVFVPPQWFSVSIFFIECFTLLIPCYQIFKHHALKNETLAAIADWEVKNKEFGSIDSDPVRADSPSHRSFTTCNDSEKGFAQVNPQKTSINRSIASRKSQMYTMVALDHALRWNADPLQKFAALKDFSGENVSFLTHIQLWKKAWTKQQPQRSISQLFSKQKPEEQSEQDMRPQFNQALRIYAAFVSAEHAEFPINISSKALRALDDMFARPAELLFGDTRSESTYNSATPFEEVQKSGIRVEVNAVPTRLSNDSWRSDEVWYWGEIPSTFEANIFDESEAEIKYLVLTNTWPKFVNAGYAEQILDSEGKSLRRRVSHMLHWDVRDKS